MEFRESVSYLYLDKLFKTSDLDNVDKRLMESICNMAFIEGKSEGIRATMIVNNGITS